MIISLSIYLLIIFHPNVLTEENVNGKSIIWNLVILDAFFALQICTPVKNMLSVSNTMIMFTDVYYPNISFHFVFIYLSKWTSVAQFEVIRTKWVI